MFGGNFQAVHPDEFTASKTPSYPSLRMALSVTSHMGWPIECWDVSTAFLYARLFGDRDTDLGGNEIFMRPPKILIDIEVVAEGVVWKIKKALYGLRTSPIAWETERDNAREVSLSHPFLSAPNASKRIREQCPHLLAGQARGEWQIDPILLMHRGGLSAS